MQQGCIFQCLADYFGFRLHILHLQNSRVILNHCVFWIGTKCLFRLIWKIIGVKIEVLEMLGEKSSTIFLLISASTAILVFSWVTQEYICWYPQITEFIPWWKPRMGISDPQNSTFRKKCPLETRALQWQYHLNISISLASTWSEIWLIADSAGYPHLLGICSQFLLSKPGWWLFFLPNWKDITLWVFFTYVNHRINCTGTQQRRLRRPYITDFYFLNYIRNHIDLSTEFCIILWKGIFKESVFECLVLFQN